MRIDQHRISVSMHLVVRGVTVQAGKEYSFDARNSALYCFNAAVPHPNSYTISFFLDPFYLPFHFRNIILSCVTKYIENFK